MVFRTLVGLLGLVAAVGCSGGGAPKVAGSPGGGGAGGGPAAIVGQLAATDFARPWIRLSVPTVAPESVISIAADAHGYVALVRLDTSVGKIFGPVTHRLALSSDGVNWSSEDLDPLADPSVDNRYFRAIAYGAGQYAAVGVAGADSVLRISSDALSWRPPVIGGAGLWCATYAGGRWFVGGASGYLATSLDGFSWATQQLDDGAINAVAFGNGVYVAAGNDAFWVSSDGQAWQPISTVCATADNCPGATPPGSTFPQSAAIAVDHLFFGGGKFFGSSSSSGFYFTSPDGQQWQAVPPSQLAPDLYVGGLFLSISPDGIVQGSADGTTWTLQTTLTDDNSAGRSCATDRCFVWSETSAAGVDEESVILIPNG